MRAPSKTFVTALTILFGSFGVFSSFGVAQGPRTGSGGGTAAPRSPVEPTRIRKDAPARVETRYVVKTVTPTTGQLFVATDPPGAVILLEPFDPRNKDSRKAQVPTDRRDWVFNDLRPGEYRVAATKPEYREMVTRVTIKRNQTEHMTLDLKPILYSVSINTNVDSGELKYGYEGETLKSLQFQNKSIKLQLPAGDYVAEIEPKEPVYKLERQKFSVKEDLVVELRLTRIESTETLSPQWTDVELQNWEIPAAWHASSGNLIVSGAGVALPRDETKRHYKDFQVISDVKIVNGIGAAFVLRAQDSKNFYLLELTGEKADEPFYVRLFVVKNGVAQRIQALKIPSAAAGALKAGQFFSVQIKVIENRIAVDIVDNQAATNYPLGELRDSNLTFAVGAVGIAARSNEENAVFRFVVCTKCPQE